MPSHIFTRVGLLAGVGRHEHAIEGRGERRQRAGRGLPRVGLHGLRVPAARARRGGAPNIDEAMKVTGISPRGSWRRTRSLRCRRATHSSAARGRRRRSCSRSEARILSSRRSRISRAALGAARSGDLRRREKGCRAARTDPQGAARREEHVLGQRGRSPAARRRGMDRAGREASPTKRSSSCALPPISRTRTRSTSSRQAASFRRASSWATCCSS